jgi:hypothetical protein
MKVIKGDEIKFTRFNKTKFYKTVPPTVTILHHINLLHATFPPLNIHLNTWSVAAYVRNYELRTTDKVSSSVLVLGEFLTNPNLKTQHVTKNLA